ncbi:hypothetical protein PTTG_28573 [Puccinia triticina 1-1 BBBD Race 1]|uniref:Uncharacterized protein n=1 Tax=Puccinia triticina (isolate 1-1 / race 1 (BBBD)) TaxID=630390 RepID=A0A180GAT5_PUCT1|nr:hypothetical protein PTTG_28573 [Puccinia triticina 1-1 BBBD Race 1]
MIKLQDSSQLRHPYTYAHGLGSASLGQRAERWLGFVETQLCQNSDPDPTQPQTRSAPLDSVNPANRALNSGNDPKDASHDINQDNMNINTTLATSCEEPAVGVSLFAWTGLL